MSQPPAELIDIASRFRTEAPIVSAERIGDGHIHDSYRCATDAGAEYVLQRINVEVFCDPEGMMGNIRLVSGYAARRGAESATAGSKVEPRVGVVLPELVPAIGEESPTVRGGDGSWWRLWRAVEQSVPGPIPATPASARACGVGFGSFLELTAGLDPASLTETIPRFHDMDRRLDDLAAAARTDAAGRRGGVAADLAFVADREGRLRDYFHALSRLPPRVTHNDTKFNNILLDAVTGAPRAVIDLDTVMRGCAAFDFGDGARTGATTAPEDVADPSRMRVDLESFRAWTDGFLCAARLSPEERATLPEATSYMAAIMGIRFLTDYLSGDRYYHIDDPDHNLRRTRAQFALVADLERRQEEISRAVG